MSNCESYRELMAVLNRESLHYKALCELGLKQREILIAGDLAGLPENVKAAEKQMFALGPLTTERNQLVATIARQDRLGEATLAGVAKNVPEEMKTEFDECVKVVVREARELDEMNRANEKLIQNAVGYVNFTLNALADGGKTKPTVTSSAMKPTITPQPGPSMMNRVV
jgi:hypothetical protein